VYVYIYIHICMYVCMYVCIYLCRSFQYLASLDNFCELNIRQSSMLVAIAKAMIYNFCHHICFHSFSFANIVRQLTFPYIWQSPRIPRHVNAHESHISPLFLQKKKKGSSPLIPPPPLMIQSQNLQYSNVQKGVAHSNRHVVECTLEPKQLWHTTRI